jgi:predicted CXXCH cytochrome family protein
MITPRSVAAVATCGFTLLAIALVAAMIHVTAPDYARVRAGRVDAGYLESNNCRKCHDGNYATWHATFHRTMTQEATSQSVLGDFDRNNTIVYQGVRTDMVRENGSYWMKFTGVDGKKQQLEIGRTVGSRRIQQYLTKNGDQWVRLPIAYDLVQHRWMHLNGSFFYPDGSDYKQHVAEWNSNCVFCHNVKAQPHLDWTDRSWNTEVAELGIACGACHGPAGEHAQHALSPMTRYLWHVKDPKAPALAVTNPAKLDSDRSAMVCGHCHGQRLPEPRDRVHEMMSDGDPYDAGKNLLEFYRPVQREDKIGSFSFASRFWKDGSPRLTAYEYQGLTRSKCFRAGKPGQRITCISCHEMHGGDPRGQLTEQMKTNAACIQCHQQFATPAQLVEHTKHQADSSGSLCYNCHMPSIVYGVMSAHRTHDITIPHPDETVRFDKPNACNQCHLDWSVNRAIAASRRLWPNAFIESEDGDKRFDEPEGQRALFAGDAVTRALTAAAMTPANDVTAPLLLEAMQDRYSIVRYFAANALAAQHPEMPKPDYLASPEERDATLQAWYPLFMSERLRAAKEARERLSANRVEIDVEVGE